MLGKIIRNGKGFEFCELTETETHETLKNLEIFNTFSFLRIMSLVKLHSGNILRKLTERQLVDIALAIFEQSAIKGFPVLHAALTRKVSIVKETCRIEERCKRESAYEQREPGSETEDNRVEGHDF